MTDKINIWIQWVFLVDVNTKGANIWWLVVVYGRFLVEYVGKFSMRDEKAIISWTKEIKIPFLVDVTFSDHLWSATMLSAILDGSHYQEITKMAVITHRVIIETCYKKPNASKLGSIFNFNMLLAI